MPAISGRSRTPPTGCSATRPEQADQSGRRRMMYSAPSPPWRRCAARTLAMRDACGLRASQSPISARIAPRFVLSPGQWTLRARLAGDDEQHAHVLSQRVGEQALQAQMGSSEIEAMQIDRGIGEEPAGPDLLLPARIEDGDRRRPWWGGRLRTPGGRHAATDARRCRRFYRRLGLLNGRHRPRSATKRTDRARQRLPEREFLRAEAAASHIGLRGAHKCRGAAARAHCRAPTCPRRSAPRGRPRPRSCRSDWRP